MALNPAIKDLLENDYSNEVQTLIGIAHEMLPKTLLKKFCERYNCRSLSLKNEDVQLIAKLDKIVDKINKLLFADSMDFRKIADNVKEMLILCGKEPNKIKEIIRMFDNPQRTSS